MLSRSFLKEAMVVSLALLTISCSQVFSCSRLDLSLKRMPSMFVFPCDCILGSSSSNRCISFMTRPMMCLGWGEDWGKRAEAFSILSLLLRGNSLMSRPKSLQSWRG